MLASACVPTGRNADVASAVDQGDPGTPVLFLRWREALADMSKDSSPQEFASPAVYLAGSAKEDRLYVGSHDGWFYAKSATDGATLWKKKIGSVSSRPLVYRGRVYVGTDDGQIVCLDTMGDEQWRYATRAPVLQTPIVAGDSLIVSNEGDQVYSLDLETGTFRWLYKTDAQEEFTLRGHAGLATDGELIITGFTNGSVVALRAGTGSVAWLASLKGEAERFMDVDTTPVLVGDLVLAASSSGGLYALDQSTGRIRWHLEIESIGGIVADGDRIYLAAANLGIYAVDLLGNIVWRQGTRGGGEPTQPVVVDNYVYVALARDGLYVADKRSGEIVQYFDPGSGISATPAVGRQGMYVLSNGDILYALGVEDL